MSVWSLLVIDVVIGLLAVALLVATLVSKWLISRDMKQTISQARTERNEQYEDTKTLLEIVRDLATSARDNRKETAVAVSQVKEQIEKVSEKTAQRVVEKLPSSKDDWRGHEGGPS